MSKDCLVFSWSFPGIAPLLRIGELRRRLVVSDHVLRAWESRYGLLQPGALTRRLWAAVMGRPTAFDGLVHWGAVS